MNELQVSFQLPELGHRKGECMKYINLGMLTELPFTRLRNEQHRFEDIMAHFIKL